MTGFLLLGFFIGMGHALEADHLAAISTLNTDKSVRKSQLALRGAMWGMGHTVTLFIICSLVVLLGLKVSGLWTSALEFSVGIMLVLLGVEVIYRYHHKKIHFHLHDHGDGRQHIHAHSHYMATQPHELDTHIHQHPESFPLKAFFIGLVHGAAGSAALIALLASSTHSFLTTLLYILLFGSGSVIGMASLSFVAAWPLGWINQSMGQLHKGVNYAIGTLAIGIGGHISFQCLYQALSY